MRSLTRKNVFNCFFIVLINLVGTSSIVHAQPDGFNPDIVPIPTPPKLVSVLKQDTNQEPEEEENVALPNNAYLGEFLKPWEYIKGEKSIEINFDNAQLLNLIHYFEKEYGLTFILDNVLEPLPEGGKSPVGIRFSFKTERPLNKRQAWDVFIGLLDMAGLMVVPGPARRVYHITNNQPGSRLGTAKEPIPTFIGVDMNTLPLSDIKIRYVYFIQNASNDVIKSVAERLRSPISSPPILVGELNALILTDRASNIRAILTILKELDQSVLPETLSIVKLKKTDATKVKALYDSLVAEEKTLIARLAPGGRKTAAAYFTENVRVVADKRTNSLIVLGPRTSVKKIEEFILKEVDRDIDLPYSPLHIYRLKFIDSETTATILNDLKNAAHPESAAAQVGGLIAGTKFLKPTVTITAEKSTNSLIINADYEDYLQIYELLEKIDIEQPQVATRILVLEVALQKDKEFGIQFRNRTPTWDGVLGPNVNFQTSGIFTGVPGSVTNATQVVQRFQTPAGPVNGAARLLGDLINIAGSNVAGSTLLTLGNDVNGVWGILKILEQLTNVSVVAKPFLITTNKYASTINVGEIRRVAMSNVVGGANVQQPTLGDMQASLNVNLVPQISPDGLITLQVTVFDSNFTTLDSNPLNASGTINTSNGNRNERKISTSVIVADNQVLALGGLVIDRENEIMYKVPILGDIPVFGWFFKNKSKSVSKTSLLILISSQVLQPQSQKNMDVVTRAKMDSAQDLLCAMKNDEQLRDPVHRWLFNDENCYLSCEMDKFIKSISAKDKQIPAASRRGRYAKRNQQEPAGPATQQQSGQPILGVTVGGQADARSVDYAGPVVSDFISESRPADASQSLATQDLAQAIDTGSVFNGAAPAAAVAVVQPPTNAAPSPEPILTTTVPVGPLPEKREPSRPTRPLTNGVPATPRAIMRGRGKSLHDFMKKSNVPGEPLS